MWKPYSLYDRTFLACSASHSYALLSGSPRDSARGTAAGSPGTARETMCFCHNNLGQHGVMVDPETLEIKAIINWEFGGFWPVCFKRSVWKRAGPSAVLAREDDDVQRCRGWPMNSCEGIVMPHVGIYTVDQYIACLIKNKIIVQINTRSKMRASKSPAAGAAAGYASLACDDTKFRGYAPPTSTETPAKPGN